jgi:DNA-binding transcriptional ArsR family regulator
MLGNSGSKPLEDPLLHLVTGRLRAICEPTRIRLILRLEQEGATVQTLTDELTTTHQNVSKHLAILYQSGIVTRRREGNTVFYSLADYSVCRLIEQATKSTMGYVEELASITGVEVTE